MNAAPAFFEDPATGRQYVYVGNRTDGQPRHPRPGILVVDVTNPATPTVVNEIGPPFAGNIGETTRELRVWWEKRLLVVLSFRCSARIHDCASDEELRERGEFPVRPTLRFFDLTDPANPVHRMTYVPTQRDGTVRVPHEFFLWVDPKDDNRALLWASTPTSSCDTNRANLVIYDVSGVAAGIPPTPISQGNWNHLYENGCNAAQYDFDLALHSMGVNATGTRTHLAYLRGHYLTLDTRAVAFLPNAGVGTDTDHDEVPDRLDAVDLSDDLLTPPASRPRWGASPFVCTKPQAATGLGCADGHSAVEVPGPRKPLVLTTDEFYGTFTAHYHGCPWGWVRLIDISHPETPVIVGEYRVKENVCPPKPPDADEFTSFASHNPTVLEPSLALLTWHSAGLQAIDLADPTRPEQAGWFSPTPLPIVATEDPALSRGLNKVVMWSYPIVEDGLVYVVDVRNGLYVLSYTGPHQGTVLGTRFMEGNSNLGELGTCGTSIRVASADRGRKGGPARPALRLTSPRASRRAGSACGSRSRLSVDRRPLTGALDRRQPSAGPPYLTRRSSGSGKATVHAAEEPVPGKERSSGAPISAAPQHDGTPQSRSRVWTVTARAGPEQSDQAGRCNPARVTLTSRRTAALEGRLLAAASA